MKKLLTTVILAIMISGCTTGRFMLDVAEIFIDEPKQESYLHRAEVQSVTIGKDKKIIFFTDGYNYEINNYISVKPGDMVKIFKEDDGSYRAEVDHDL